MSDSTIASTAGGSLKEFAGKYCVELERLNYGRETINLYLRSIRRLSQLMVSHSLALDQLTPEIAAELVKRKEWDGDRRQYAVFAVRRFVTYLVTQGVVKSPAPTARELVRAGLRGDYEDYLRRQRGLSERTIGHCWRFADRFLDFRFGDAEIDLGAITPGDIVAFLQRLTSRKAPFRDKTPPTHLRNFFRYLFQSGALHSKRRTALRRTAAPSPRSREGGYSPRGSPGRHPVWPPQLSDDHPSRAFRSACAGGDCDPANRAFTAAPVCARQRAARRMLAGGPKGRTHRIVCNNLESSCVRSGCGHAWTPRRAFALSKSVTQSLPLFTSSSHYPATHPAPLPSAP